ncbi:alpha/beta-hydrolase, partial [Martensiomyces pterosporus]
TWTCSVNCQSPATAGTIVDYHWDTSIVSSFGYVAHRDDTQEIIVSWRGTTAVTDWIENITFDLESWPQQVTGSSVHTGFHAAYDAAADSIKNVVAGLVQQYPNYKIVLTGHSLGGAEAAIGAADFALNHPEWVSKMELYTYGEPRVGNPTFANWLSQQTFPIYRVVNKGDTVPQLPLRVMGFQHHAQEVWYNLSGQTQFCGSDGENKACQDSLSLFQLDVADHSTYPGLH